MYSPMRRACHPVLHLPKKIKEEGEPARDAYLNMLKGGNSNAPVLMLQEAGLDLTKPEAIQSALELFDKTVDELDKLISK